MLIRALVLSIVATGVSFQMASADDKPLATDAEMIIVKKAGIPDEISVFRSVSGIPTKLTITADNDSVSCTDGGTSVQVDAGASKDFQVSGDGMSEILCKSLRSENGSSRITVKYSIARTSIDWDNSKHPGLSHAELIAVLDKVQKGQFDRDLAGKLISNGIGQDREIKIDASKAIAGTQDTVDHADGDYVLFQGSSGSFVEKKGSKKQISDTGTPLKVVKNKKKGGPDQIVPDNTALFPDKPKNAVVCYIPGNSPKAVYVAGEVSDVMIAGDSKVVCGLNTKKANPKAEGQLTIHVQHVGKADAVAKLSGLIQEDQDTKDSMEKAANEGNLEKVKEIVDSRVFTATKIVTKYQDAQIAEKNAADAEAKRIKDMEAKLFGDSMDLELGLSYFQFDLTPVKVNVPDMIHDGGLDYVDYKISSPEAGYFVNDNPKAATQKVSENVIAPASVISTSSTWDDDKGPVAGHYAVCYDRIKDLNKLVSQQLQVTPKVTAYTVRSALAAISVSDVALCRGSGPKKKVTLNRKSDSFDFCFKKVQYMYNNGRSTFALAAYEPISARASFEGLVGGNAVDRVQEILRHNGSVQPNPAFTKRIVTKVLWSDAGDLPARKCVSTNTIEPKFAPSDFLPQAAAPVKQEAAEQAPASEQVQNVQKVSAPKNEFSDVKESDSAPVVAGLSSEVSVVHQAQQAFMYPKTINGKAMLCVRATTDASDDEKAHPTCIPAGSRDVASDKPAELKDGDVQQKVIVVPEVIVKSGDSKEASPDAPSLQ